MADDETYAARKSNSLFLQHAISTALIVTIGGLIYTANSGSGTESAAQQRAVITGELEVSYMMHERSGSIINASRVEYFPAYVLVTTQDDVTVLLAVDRLIGFKATRIGADTARRSK
jgi:hypothetical protein